MMEHMLFYFTTFIVGVAVILFLYRQTDLSNAPITDNLPEDMAGAKLFYNEQYLEVTAPYKLRGIPDQVWELPDRSLIITETKTRKIHKPTFSDQIQVTACAFLLKHHPKTKDRVIRPYAYIRFPSEFGARFVETKLLEPHQLHNIRQRYIALKNRKLEAYGPEYPKLCNGCGHRVVCQLTYASIHR